MEINVTAEQVGIVLMYLVAGGIFVTKLVDGLRKVEALKDVNAGSINQVVSFVVAMAGFLLTYLNQGDKIATGEALGLDMATAIVSTYVIAFLAWLIHKLVNLITKAKAAAKPGTFQHA